MPELPDLNHFASNLNKLVAGKTVEYVEVLNTSKLKVPKEALKKGLEKQQLTEVERVGKELHFKFSNGNVLGLHLMLNGKLYYFDGKSNQKYKIIELLFGDETGLVLADFQGMANATLNPEEKDAPDALSATINYKFLKETLQSRASIKNLLLDQHVIRGIGNAYADEILWDAKISPFSIANKIPDDKIKALVRSIKEVLVDAEKQIKKSHSDIIAGEIRDFLKIHNAKKKESPTGSPIYNKVVSSRKTYYTDEQELYK